MKANLLDKILITAWIVVVIGSIALAVFTRPAAADQVAVLKTLGMTCESCAGRIEQALLARPGVAEVTVDVAASRVTVAYATGVTTPETLAEAVTASGYRSGIVQNLTLAQYQERSDPGRAAGNRTTGNGCGSRCCNP